MLLPQVWVNGFANRCHVQVEEELEDKQGCQQGYTSHLKIIISCTTLKYPKKTSFFSTPSFCSRMSCLEQIQRARAETMFLLVKQERFGKTQLLSQGWWSRPGAPWRL